MRLIPLKEKLNAREKRTKNLKRNPTNTETEITAYA